MGRDGIQKCKRVARKARRVVNNAVTKVKSAQFTRMIKRNINHQKNKCQKCINSDFAKSTGIVMLSSAIISVATGGVLINAVRSGASLALSNVLSDVLLKKKKRGEEREKWRRGSNSSFRSMDEVMDEARRGTLHSYTTLKKKDYGTSPYGSSPYASSSSSSSPRYSTLKKRENGTSHYGVQDKGMGTSVNF
jgi:hypothetical protein